MTARQESVAQGPRIGADEVKALLQPGVQVTMPDVRNEKAWVATGAKPRSRPHPAGRPAVLTEKRARDRSLNLTRRA
jgi:hypothetical protein